MSIVSIFTTVGDIVKYGWPLFLVAALIIAKIKGKNWLVDVVIIEKRGQNLIKTNDRAGRYVDKFTGLTGYKLMKSKDTMPVIDYNWVMHNVDKPLSIFDRIMKFIRPTIGTMFLFRYGSRQYKPLKVRDKPESEKELQLVKDAKGNDIYVETYSQFDPRGYLEALDLEIVDWDNMNFLTQEIRSTQERRKKRDQWLKTVLLPLGLIAAATIVSIVMMKFSMEHAATLNTESPSNIKPEKAELPNIPVIGDAFNPQ